MGTRACKGVLKFPVSSDMPLVFMYLKALCLGAVCFLPLGKNFQVTLQAVYSSPYRFAGRSRTSGHESLVTPQIDMLGSFSSSFPQAKVGTESISCMAIFSRFRAGGPKPPAAPRFARIGSLHWENPVEPCQVPQNPRRDPQGPLSLRAPLRSKSPQIEREPHGGLCYLDFLTLGNFRKVPVHGAIWVSNSLAVILTETVLNIFSGVATSTQWDRAHVRGGCVLEKACFCLPSAFSKVPSLNPF